MEFIGRLVIKNQPKIPCEVEQLMAVYKTVIFGELCVGLSKNNFLVEFGTRTGDIRKGLKLDACYNRIEILHDFTDNYFVVLIKPENMGLSVYQPRSKTFEKVFDCQQTFVSFHIEDSNGHETLHVQYSPTREEVMDFSKREEIQDNADITDEVLESLCR